MDFTGIFCASCATPLYCIRHSKTSCIVTRRHFCSPNHRWTGDLSPDKVGSSSFGWKICLCEAYGRPTLGCPSDIMSREPQTPSTSGESERKFTESSTRKMGFAKNRKQHKKKQQRAGRKPAGSLLGHLHKAGRSLFFFVPQNLAYYLQNLVRRDADGGTKCNKSDDRPYVRQKPI